MANFSRSAFCRFIASFISLVLVQTAPGLGVYQALAQVRTAAGTAATTGGAAPVPVQLSIPSAGMAMPAASLGLDPSLTAPAAVPSPVAPAVAVDAAVAKALPASAPIISVMPLSFRSPLLPAAAKAVSVDAAGSSVSPALAPNSPVAALNESAASISKLSAAAPASAPSALLSTLSRLFDGSRPTEGGLAVLSAAATPESRPSALTPALAPASTPDAQPPVPPSGDAPQTPGRARVSVGLALAAAGAAAAWYTSAWAVATLGALIAPFVAVPALVLAGSWISLGALAGFAAFSVETWTGFPADLKNSSVSAGAMTFRFWARFGLIFDSVLRGGSTDEAMKKDLSANIFKYPVIAWVFVLAGYAMAPVAFALGAAYRLIGTPFLAAFRGAREVIVGFLPWMARVFRFLSRLVLRIFPFAGGLILGAAQTAFYGAAAGAVVLAGPIARDAFESEYKPSTLPGWIGYRLTQLAALAATLATGAVGAVVGLLVSPVHIVMGALELAFDWSNVSASADAFFTRWMASIKNDDGLQALINRGFPSAEKNLSLPARVTRTVNATAISLVEALTLPFVSLATIVRASLAAVRGADAKRGDSSSRRIDESGAQAPVAVREGFVLPAILGGVGALAGAGIYGYLLFTPVGWIGWASIAAAGLIGGSLGLALSQPQAWSGASATLSEGALSGRQAYGGWLDARARVAAALRGDGDPRVQKLPSLFGALAAIPSALLGGVLTLAGAAVTAAWSGFMAVITQFLPALKRFFNWALEVVKNIVPFVFGFAFGTIWGVLKSGWFMATNLFRGGAAISDREDDSKRPSEAQIGFGLLLALTLVVPAAVVFVGGFALGAVVGLPVAFTHGTALGVKWAGTGEKSENYFRTWERRSLPAELKKAVKVADLSLGANGAEMPIWRLYVRFASLLLAAIPTAIALTVSGGAAYLRSLQDAKLEKSKPEAEAPSESAAPSSPEKKADEVPAGKPPVWLAATLGAIGLGAGIVAAIAFGPAWLAGLAGWKLWLLGAAAYAGVPVLGLSAGLAVSQPVLWKNLVPSVIDHAKGGFARSYDYWTAAGKAVGLSALYRLPGAVLGLGWGAAGAVFGLGAAGAVAAYDGARQVVYEILPFLRTAFETLMKVLRRVVPFGFGLVAGLISGVVGSAAFGALLLGRPYFKHVVADDFKHSGAIGFLGNLFLKTVALGLGIVFGLVGVAAGVVAAAPYALTASVAFAFRFAEIGGPVQKFFDQWTYGALRAEMRRLNQLTDRFQFPEGSAAISDGWIRMANIFPATFAAAFAGAIAGWVGYFRSLGVAYKAAKTGQPVPESSMDRESERRWNGTWRASKRAASSFFAWGVSGAALGLGLWLLTSWTPLGLAGWLLVGALAGVGVVGALAVGGVIATIALILWLDGQLR